LLPKRPVSQHRGLAVLRRNSHEYVVLTIVCGGQPLYRDEVHPTIQPIRAQQQHKPTWWRGQRPPPKRGLRKQSVTVVAYRKGPHACSAACCASRGTDRGLQLWPHRRRDTGWRRRRLRFRGSFFPAKRWTKRPRFLELPPHQQRQKQQEK
ncbi:unnamed protein product, partial [Scytosiphon promiscuus]